MRNTWTVFSPILLLLVAFTTSNIFTIESQVLSSSFYNSTCPEAIHIISNSIWKAIAGEIRMAASLIRLHFHDCFVQGCDASILLDDDPPNVLSEKNAEPNKDSARGFEVIEKAKSDVEKICPGVVSCADIIAVAARAASVYVGGPAWRVKFGRRDSRTANLHNAEAELPRFNESLQGLVSSFRSRNLSVRDMVALSGSHTLGQAQCRFFRDRIFGDRDDIDSKFAGERRLICGPSNDESLVALDYVTPNRFDNNYFKNLQQKKGLLITDQVLFNTGFGLPDSIVAEYSASTEVFASDFAAAMEKMGDIKPLTGTDGEIRKICSAVNK